MKALTVKQEEFLASYFEDILFGNKNLRTADLEEFVARVVRMDFDDGEAATAAKLRIARNLNAAGLMDHFDDHDGPMGKRIHLMFSRLGAERLFDLMHRDDPNPAPTGP